MPPKASGKGAAKQLTPGYCPQNVAIACGKGAAEDSKAGQCLTSLSEATTKVLGKRPGCRKKPPAKAPRGSGSQATATAPRMQPQPVARALRRIRRQASA